MMNLDTALGQATNNNERLALSMFKAMEDRRTGQAIAELCSDEFVWENSGLPTVHGIAGYRALAEDGGFAKYLPIIKNIRSFSVDVLHVASSGTDGNGVVFTERIDHHWDGDGRDLMTPHICGVVEIIDGKIVALREYYDTAVYQQTPTEPDPAHALS